MIKRIVDITDGPTFLNIENDQLVLTRRQERIGQVPCEDVGVLLIENRYTTYTHAVLLRLIQCGAVVVLCDEFHLPAGLLLPTESNTLHTLRLRTQAAAPLPLRKRLWKQIVVHKIRGQAGNLAEGSRPRALLEELAGEVKSGDTTNCEGRAAAIYWPALMAGVRPERGEGDKFLRDPEGDWPNPLLNYGYMVFRAAVARAIVAGGLHPALGLYHSHRNNPFVLADDLLEPLRPRIDRTVVELLRAGCSAIDKESKGKLLGLMTDGITVAGHSGPLMVGLHRVVASLVRCFEGAADERATPRTKLDLPE